MSWQEATEWERNWWGNCANTLGEEMKQLLYAEKMGLKMFHDGKSPFNIDMKGASVIDIGGGPCSLLLKCHNVRGTVVDPCNYPKWVYLRYDKARIQVVINKAEEYHGGAVDEIWIYNCLQ